MAAGNDAISIGFYRRAIDPAYDANGLQRRQFLYRANIAGIESRAMGRRLLG